MTLIDNPKIELYEGDCIEIIQSLSDNSIDCIITDPPYNISRQRKFTMKGKKPINLDFGEWDKWDSEDEYLDWCKIWLNECHRILKDTGNILIWHDKAMPFPYMLSKMGYKVKNLFAWCKSNPIPSFLKRNFLSGFELSTWAIKDTPDKKTFNFKTQKEMLNFASHSSVQGNERTEHPTQKPLKVIKHLIEVLSNENNLILDIFAGSGTTGKAAYELNRNCILIEKEPEYCEIIKKRIGLCEPYLIR